MQAMSVYLSNELRQKVNAIAAGQGRSASSLIAEAVKARITPNEKTNSVAIHQLRRIEQRLDRIVRDTTLIKEALLLFVRVWLENSPPVEEAYEEAAAQSAAARFERFLDLVALHAESGVSLAESQAESANGQRAPESGL